MRFYGKKFFGNYVRQEIAHRKETRDAILWDVLPDQRLCRVKIQGSNQLVVAHYPENWEQTPYYLKPGNAVKVMHTSGVRGRIEVIGCGQLIPTPVTGDTLPPGQDQPDAVIEGGHVGASTPPAMSVYVEAATYRLAGTEYESAAGTIVIEAAPAVGQYRYDVIYADDEENLGIVKGTAAASNPIMPSIPAGTIQLGYVLVYGGMTAVTNTFTNREWSEEGPSIVTVTPTDDELDWDELSTNVRVEVFDQYGNPITTAAPGWYMTLEFATIGNGTLHSDEEGDSDTKIGGHSGANNYYDFLYTRDQLPTDISPVFKGTCEADRNISGYAHIVLYDEDGLPMAGQVHIPAYSVIQEEGVPLTPRSVINFIGEGITAEDDAVNERTNVSLVERNANFTLFPEYAGAAWSPSGSDNDPGIYGIASGFEAVGTTIHNYHEWKSSITTGLQNYDINLKIPMPFNFTGLQVGTNVALTVDIKTEENTTDNNKIDITLQRDGNAATSSLTNQKSAVAATWITVGFDETDAILAALVAGDILNVTIRMYSQNSKYARIGKINLQVKLR